MANTRLYIWTLSAFCANRHVFHRAVKVGTDAAGNPVYRTFCGANVQHTPVVLDYMTPKGRLCANCAQIERNRLYILIRLVNIRKEAAAWVQQQYPLTGTG
jgi:hypothetical protein